MIRVTLKPYVLLSDYWLSKEDWEEVYNGNLPTLKELILEDTSAFLEDCGGISGLITGAEWVDDEKK